MRRLAETALAVALAFATPAQAQQAATAADLLERCRTDPPACDSTFAEYSVIYAILHIPELRQQKQNQHIVDAFKGSDAFEGICLPRDELLGNRLAEQLGKAFLRWMDDHPEATALRPSQAVREAMRASYPCS